MNQKSTLNKTILIACISVFILIGSLTTIAAEAASVTLAWNANNPAPEGYRVYARRGDQAYNYSLPAWQGTGSSATVNNLQDQTEYYFVVRAYQGYQESANSNEVRYVSPVPENSVPTPPNNTGSDTTPPYWDGATPGIGLATPVATGGKVTVEFDTAIDAVNGRNLKFNVYYSPSSSWDNQDWTGNSVIADAAVRSGGNFTHAVTVTRLTDGVRYTFGVRAEDQSGNEDTNTSTLRATPIVTESPTSSEPNDNSTTGLVPQTDWRLIYVDSEELAGENGRGVNAFDSNPGTFWHTEWFHKSVKHPHEIQIDLGATYRLESFRYLPRQDGSSNGRIRDYAFYVSDDASNWKSAAASGTFANTAAEKTVVLNAPAVGRYIRLVALSEVAGQAWTSLAELNVVGTLFSEQLPTTDWLSQTDWRLIYVDSEELAGENGRGVNAFDGNPRTFWHTEWFHKSVKHPHEIQIDLGATYRLESFRYLPRQDGSSNGRIRDYAFYVSDDASNWKSAAASGTFANTAAEKTVVLNAPAVGRYIRLVALSEVAGQAWTSLAEIKVAGSLY